MYPTTDGGHHSGLQACVESQHCPYPVRDNMAASEAAFQPGLIMIHGMNAGLELV